MYSRGNIIYFTPFYFPNGSTPKPKYLIILDEDDKDGSILASLTTSKDCVPRFHEDNVGCIDLPSINFNCYRIKGGTPITKNGVSFPHDTYIYGYRLATFSVRNLHAQYAVEGVDYQIVGELLDDELAAIIDCMKSSSSVKRGYRRKLGSDI